MDDSSIVFTGHLKNKLYLVDFNKSKANLETCLVAKSSVGWLWHRQLAHVGMKNLAKLQKDEHILGRTNVYFEKDRICSACQAEKQVGVSHPPKSIMTTTQPLEQEDNEDPKDGQEAIDYPRLRLTIQQDHPFDNILGSL